MRALLKKAPALLSMLAIILLLPACSQMTPSDGEFAQMDYTYYLSGGNPPPYTRTIFSSTNF